MKNRLAKARNCTQMIVLLKSISIMALSVRYHVILGLGSVPSSLTGFSNSFRVKMLLRVLVSSIFCVILMKVSFSVGFLTYTVS